MTSQTLSPPDVQSQSPSELQPPPQRQKSKAKPLPAENLPSLDAGFTAADSEPSGEPSAAPLIALTSGAKRKPGRPRKPRDKAEITSLADALAQQTLLLGMAMTMVMPVTGLTIINRSDMAAKAVVAVALDHPKLMSGIESLLRAGKYAVLGEISVALVVAVGVDIGAFQPDAMLVQKFCGPAIAQINEAHAAQIENQVKTAA